MRLPKRGSGSMPMPKKALEQELMDSLSAPRSIADAIMRKRKMADGGMVEPDNREAGWAPYDRMNAKAARDPLYDEDLSDQPLESIGDDLEDEDQNDKSMIAEIQRRMRAKRGGM